jgi:hypothetical protein
MQQLTSEMATAAWIAGAQGRLVRRMMGFNHAEDRR